MKTAEPPAPPSERASVGDGGLRFGLMEFAGAFGDLGTLVPFLVAYITLAHVDPYGMLLGFGVAMIASGLYYRTPFPVQPMKAIGAVATTNAAHGVALTNPNVVYAAGLATGLIWLAARTHRARESGRAHHGAAGGAGHRARPGVLLHARRSSRWRRAGGCSARLAPS